jgi:hypothetical protein
MSECGNPFCSALQRGWVRRLQPKGIACAAFAACCRGPDGQMVYTSPVLAAMRAHIYLLFMTRIMAGLATCAVAGPSKSVGADWPRQCRCRWAGASQARHDALHILLKEVVMAASKKPVTQLGRAGSGHKWAV